MKLEIKKPCNENWDKMKIGLVTRHCDVCNKGVMDFTKMNRGEIISYMLSNPNDEVCGRMNKDQFDFHHDDIPILIEALRKYRPSNSFMILALVCLSLASCSDEPEGNIKTPDPINKIETVDASNLDSIDPRHDKVEVNPNKTKFRVKGEVEIATESMRTLGEVAVSGGICVVDPPDVNPLPFPKEVTPPSDEVSDQIYQFADQMPEFIGGTDALFKFIKSKLTYPNYERENNIEGNVYVRFVVEKDGSITQPEVLKSVKDSKNFDKEVLRILSTMPKWIPAAHKEKTVRAYMTLPFRFKLTD